MRPSGFLGNLNLWILNEMDMVIKLLSTKQGDIIADITEYELVRDAHDIGIVAFITGETTTSLKNIYLYNKFKMVTTLPMTSC